MTEEFTEVDTLPPHYTPLVREMFDVVLAVSLAVLASMYLLRRVHLHKCIWCGKWHPLRPILMTADEFLRIYCGGSKALSKINDRKYRRKHDR